MRKIVYYILMITVMVLLRIQSSYVVVSFLFLFPLQDCLNSTHLDKTNTYSNSFLLYYKIAKSLLAKNKDRIYLWDVTKSQNNIFLHMMEGFSKQGYLLIFTLSEFIVSSEIHIYMTSRRKISTQIRIVL